MPIDLTRIAEHIREVAAARIVPRFQKLAAHEISSKTSLQDLVTVADIEAEADLIRILTAVLPGSLALGEEAGVARRGRDRRSGGQSRAGLGDRPRGWHE
jgi:fructose-1,6-bisphosphatase/inositol monophosphatase family enzyme